MPTAIFLFLAAFVALNTVNALRPPATHRSWWARPPWFPTLFASELAPLRFVAGVAITAAYLAAGGGRTPMGRFAIGLMGTSLLGSGAVIAIAARAGAAAEAALSDPPGTGNRHGPASLCQT